MDDLIKDLTALSVSSKELADSLRIIRRKEQNQVKKLTLLKENLTLIERKSRSVHFDPSIESRLHDIIDSIKKEVTDLEIKAKSEFGKQLQIELQSNYFNLDGNYPKLKTKFYTISIDIHSNKASLYYGPEVEKLESCSAVPEETVKTLFKHHNRIVERNFDEALFIENLKKAYDFCIIENKQRPGDEIPISQILPRFIILIQPKKFLTNPKKINYCEYDRSMFSYDLFRLKQRQIDRFQLILVTARRNETRKSQEILWIPASIDKPIGETISKIKFTEVK